MTTFSNTTTKARAFLLLAAMLFATVSQAQTADTASMTIAEDMGLFDQYGEVLTIGMTRSQVRVHATNGNCDTASDCVFRFSSDTAAIQVWFDANDYVTDISVNQNGLFDRDKWPSEIAGRLVDGMSVGDAATLYTGLGYEVEIVNNLSGDLAQIAELGYSYKHRVSCYFSSCTRTSVHYISGPSPVDPPGAVRYFEGEIVLKNPSKRRKTYNVELLIVDPDGGETFANFSVRIEGRSTVSYDPGTFVDLEGPVGTYTYQGTLYNSKGRKRGTSTGEFSLVVGN